MIRIRFRRRRRKKRPNTGAVFSCAQYRPKDKHIAETYKAMICCHDGNSEGLNLGQIAPKFLAESEENPYSSPVFKKLLVPLLLLGASNK